MLRFVLAVGFVLTLDAPALMDWGKAEDPVGDCEFIEKDGKLTIKVPAGYHDFDPEPDYKANGPRAFREVEGDFTVEVHVTGLKHAPKGNELEGKTNTFRAGTLLVWADDKNFVRFDRAAMVKEGKDYSTVYFHIFKDGKRPYQNAPIVKDEETVLRIERKGDRINASAVQGKTVTKIAEQKVDLPAKVRVGVGAVNASKMPFEVSFDSFKIEKNAKK